MCDSISGSAKIPEVSLRYRYCTGISKVSICIDTYRYLIDSYP
jgi:hypothetical protein